MSKMLIVGFVLTVFGLGMVSSSCVKSKNNGSTPVIEKGFKRSGEQLKLMLESNSDLTKLPRSVDENGNTIFVSSYNWVSGFYPGCSWFMYEYTNDATWKAAAEKWTKALEQEQFNTNTHDVGFIIYCSYGQGYRLLGNEAWEGVIINAAKSLSTRYNENVGCILSWSWGKNTEGWEFPVIIDNMMNLELMFKASELSGDNLFREIAIKHAETTMENHFRDDFSSYHVVDYDPVTGEVRGKRTHQGSSDESEWARGQGWGLYGYTVCYRETKNPEFLKMAENIAAYIINHPNTPVDLIPMWDYDMFGKVGEPRDASAASLIASALLELSTLVESEKSEKYLNYAKRILESLASDEYLAETGTNNFFILKHATGNKPKNSEIDVPLIYGDYYFLEALIRLEKLSTTNN